MPGVPKGYQCPLVPNGFDPAGSIYRLEKDGTYFRVKDFTGDPALTALGTVKREVPISNYVLTDTQQANAGMSLDLLQKVAPDVRLQVAIAARRIEGTDAMPLLIEVLARSGDDLDP